MFVLGMFREISLKIIIQIRHCGANFFKTKRISQHKLSLFDNF